MKSLAVVLLLRAVLVASLSNAPEDYFGGTEHATYLSWVVEKGASYDSSAYFPAATSDETQGAALHWRIDADNVYIGVAARATGWVGLGLADAGGMKGADIVIFEASKPGVLLDTFVKEDRYPIVDDCQDWTFVESRVENGFIIFEGVRKHNTADVNDHPVIDDTHGYVAAQRIIAAWGDEDEFANHGSNRARGGIRWYGKGDELTNFRSKMATDSDGHFDLFVGNHSIAAIETDYVDFCFAWDPDFVGQGVPKEGVISIIAAEIILDPDGGRFVHHATITGSTEKSEASRTCFNNTGLYNTPLYGWAPGTLPFVMPDGVGFTLGPGGGDQVAFSAGGLQSFRINMHYNNPDLIKGSIDNGGLRVYYTLEKRAQELGVAAFGDIFTHMRGTPIDKGLTSFTFHCPKECSEFVFGGKNGEPVTVVHEYFHMHEGGVSGVQELVRNGEVVRQSNANFFEFNQAGLHAVRQEAYQVFPGDTYRTTCYYRSENGTQFGKPSQDEMCETIVLYYPAKNVLGLYPWGCVYDVPVKVCNASYTSENLPDDDNIKRTFATTDEVADVCLEKAICPGETSSTDSDMNSPKQSKAGVVVGVVTSTALLVLSAALHL